jgi:hypothetical protein
VSGETAEVFPQLASHVDEIQYDVEAGLGGKSPVQANSSGQLPQGPGETIRSMDGGNPVIVPDRQLLHERSP